MSDFDGLLLIDKSSGPTSHDVVLAVRRALPNNVKVGHTGTLDPRATGLLILVVGAATKAAASLQCLPKVYSGRVRLGQETDTGDLDGALVRESSVPELEAAAVQAAMSSFVGVLELPAPSYSAIKYRGKPLYAYARKGIKVPTKYRSCEVHAWSLDGWAPPELGFHLRCSHGTYARSLAASLGAKLGCGAVLSALRRESIGAHSIADALTLDDALKLSLPRLAERLRRVVAAPAAAPLAR